MGQQQLLLVILVTIIVGIATVVAINTFGSAADNANVDAVRNDLLSMASSAQGYYMKPAMMGGGGKDFEGITFNNMGSSACKTISSDGLTCTNENGTYTIGGATAAAIGENSTTFDVVGVPAQAGGSIKITIGPGDDDTSTGETSMGDYDDGSS